VAALNCQSPRGLLICPSRPIAVLIASGVGFVPASAIARSSTAAASQEAIAYVVGGPLCLGLPSVPLSAAQAETNARLPGLSSVGA
jgi:hypothetical protein